MSVIPITLSLQKNALQIERLSDKSKSKYINIYSCYSPMNINQVQHLLVSPQLARSSEKVFKYINLLTIFMLVFCIKGFLNFRQFCAQRGYYVFSQDSLVWCAVGFVGIFIFKYSYYHFMKGTIEAILHPKYRVKQQKIKLKQLLDLSFDSIYYLISWISGYFLFRNQYWFPQIVGGAGKCDLIHKEYPNWPSNTGNLEKYFMIQLGMSLFSIFEIAFFKRKTQRKFHELLLHHCLTSSLILFSMMCNEITLGSAILITLDLSNIIYVFGYAFMKTKYNTQSKTIILSIIMASVWVYLRVLVFPFCLLASAYANKPTPQDQWYIINFEYGYLFFMTLVLYGMSIFWTYSLIKLSIQSVSGKRLQKSHNDVKKN